MENNSNEMENIENPTEQELTEENNVENTLDVAVEKLENEIVELKDKLLRNVAEFDNFRKRTAKEKNELLKSAGEDVIKSLLDVVDDTDRALEQMETTEDFEAFKQGILLIFNKLKSTLQAKGLEAMSVKGDEFNPEIHEAITEIPAPSPEFSGKVIDEVQKGYTLNDKIIRHAKVVIGK